MALNEPSPASSAPVQPGISNMASTPLANIPLTTSGPLSDAHKQIVIDSILPIVLAAAKQQRPDKPITSDKLLELRAKFTDDLCRWWIDKAHEVKREYIARGLPLPNVKRDLEGDAEGQGREKRAKTEEDEERDVEILVDDRTNTRTQSAVTGEISASPAFSERTSSSKEDDVDMFSPPEVLTGTSKSIEPTEEEDEEELDMELDSDVDESPPPPPPVLASKQPTPASEAPLPPDKPGVPDSLPPSTTTDLRQSPIPEEQSPEPAPVPPSPRLSPADVSLPPEVPDAPTTASQPSPASPTAPEPAIAPAQTSTSEPSPQPNQTSVSAPSEHQAEPAPAPAPTTAPEPEPAPAEAIAEPTSLEPEIVYATVPGIWGIGAGAKMSTTLEFELVIDDATYDAARRWAARWDTFTDGPADAFVSVRLLCLPLVQVQELDAEVRAGTRPSAPVDVAEAMAKLPITWPVLGTLMVTDGSRSLYGDIFKPGTPLDVSSLIQPGINTLRIFLIGASHTDKMYALHAAQPSTDEARAVADVWKTQRALVSGAERGVTSFGMAQLGAGEGMIVEAAA